MMPRAFAPVLFCSFAALLAIHPAAAAPVSLANKTVHLAIAQDDDAAIYARTLAPYLAKALPGQPAVVVDAAAGRDARAALDVFVATAKSDGTTVLIDNTRPFNPLARDLQTALAEGATLVPIGGNASPGTALVVAVRAFDRLYDEQQPPVIVGGRNPPSPGAETALWGKAYLYWNVRWALAQANTDTLAKALDSGTIDMAALSNADTAQRLVASDRFQILCQSGMLQNGAIDLRPEFLGPLFGDLIANEITDETQNQAYDYWRTVSALGIVAALPQKTPSPIADAFKAAFATATDNPEFQAKFTIAGGLPTAQSAVSVAKMLTALVQSPPRARAAIRDMAAKQGLAAGG